MCHTPDAHGTEVLERVADDLEVEAPCATDVSLSEKWKWERGTFCGGGDAEI